MLTATQTLIEVQRNRKQALAALEALRLERVDQFKAIVIELQSLVNILGASLLPSDIAQSIPRWHADKERDLTLVRLKRLQSELERCKAELVRSLLALYSSNLIESDRTPKPKSWPTKSLNSTRSTLN